MSLTQDLESLKRESASRLPPVAVTLFEGLIKELKGRDFGKTALKVGDQLPVFSLPGAQGRMVSSSELLVREPLVIRFYQGAWYPFCNLELKALQDALPDIRALGAQLLAIGPMTPDNSLTLAEKHSLGYPVLSDAGLKVAAEFGLTYQMPLEIISALQKLR